MKCSFENDEMKTTAPLKAGNTEMFFSMTPFASWPEDSPSNKTLRKRCYPTFLRSCYGPLKAGAVNMAGCGSRDNVKQRILLIPLRFPSEYVAVKKHCKKYKGPQGELSLAFEKFIVSQDAELKPHI